MENTHENIQDIIENIMIDMKDKLYDFEEKNKKLGGCNPKIYIIEGDCTNGV